MIRNFLHVARGQSSRAGTSVPQYGGPLSMTCRGAAASALSGQTKAFSLQAAWVETLTEHGAPSSTGCSIVSLGTNAEEETVFVGLDTGALFCIEATTDACSSIEEVHGWIPVLEQFASAIQSYPDTCIGLPCMSLRSASTP